MNKDSDTTSSRLGMALYAKRGENARKREKMDKMHPSKTESRRTSLLHRISQSVIIVKNEHKTFAPYCEDKDLLTTLHGLQKVRQFLYFILHDENYSQASLYVLASILALIMLSTLFYILETVPSLSRTKGQRLFWDYAELVVTILFTIEYVVRLLVVKNKHLYMIRPMNVVDLLAVVPYYIEQLFPKIPSTSLRVLRVVRLARLGRLRNIFSEYIEVLSRAIRNAADEAGPMMFLMVMVEVVLFGASVYAFENGFHSDGSFESIPDTMWWAFVTITTVGYGDLAPITTMGRILGIFCMFSGIVLMSICVIIIGGNFEQVHQSIAADKYLGKNNDEKDRKVSLSEEFPHSMPIRSGTGIPGIRSGINIGVRSGIKRNQLNIDILALGNRATGLETHLDGYLRRDDSTNSLIEKRGYNLPWLKQKKYFEIFSNLIIGNIIAFLTDDDLFQVRSLNSTFYGAYYAQIVDDVHCRFNFHRAFKLASQEREFPFIQVMRLYPNELRSGRLSFITPETFPILDTFWAIRRPGFKWHQFEDVVKLSHPGLKYIKLQIDGKHPQLNIILDKLPRLRGAEITVRTHTTFTLPASHPTIEELSVVNCSLTISRNITRDRFPKLKLLYGNMSPNVKKLLTSIGVLVREIQEDIQLDDVKLDVLYAEE